MTLRRLSRRQVLALEDDAELHGVLFRVGDDGERREERSGTVVLYVQRRERASPRRNGPPAGSISLIGVRSLNGRTVSVSEFSGGHDIQQDGTLMVEDEVLLLYSEQGEGRSKAEEAQATRDLHASLFGSIRDSFGRMGVEGVQFGDGPVIATRKPDAPTGPMVVSEGGGIHGVLISVGDVVLVEQGDSATQYRIDWYAYNQAYRAYDVLARAVHSGTPACTACRRFARTPAMRPCSAGEVDASPVSFSSNGRTFRLISGNTAPAPVAERRDRRTVEE